MFGEFAKITKKLNLTEPFDVIRFLSCLRLFYCVTRETALKAIEKQLSEFAKDIADEINGIAKYLTDKSTIRDMIANHKSLINEVDSELDNL